MSDVTVREGAYLSRFGKLFSAGPVKPGDSFGAPGMGNSTSICNCHSHCSVCTCGGLLRHPAFGPMIQPLFLPSPATGLGQVHFRLDGRAIRTARSANIPLPARSGFSSPFSWLRLSAFPIGIAMATNRVFRGIFDPPIEFYRPLPPLGYLPLTIIWFGIGETQKLVLLFLAMFAPMVLNTRAGVRSVAIEQIHAAYSLGASRAQVLWHVILKGAMPEILTGMRIGIGFGWTTLVAAELVATESKALVR